MKRSALIIVLALLPLSAAACSSTPKGACASIHAVDNLQLIDQTNPSADAKEIKGQVNQMKTAATNLDKQAPDSLKESTAAFVEDINSLALFISKSNYDLEAIRKNSDQLTKFNGLVDEIKKSAKPLDEYESKNCD